MKQVVRTTMVIPSALDANLDALRLARFNGISKNALVILALRDAVKRRGLNPDKSPKIEISYE